MALRVFLQRKRGSLERSLADGSGHALEMSAMLAVAPVLELRGWEGAGGRLVAAEALEMSMMGLWLAKTRSGGGNMQLAWGLRWLLVVAEQKDGGCRVVLEAPERAE